MPASSVHMNPLPITTAARKALVTSGLKARQVAVTRNPAPKRIGIVGPTIFLAGEAAMIRATGPLAHLFELGTRSHFVTPGRRQGFQRLGKNHTIQGEYFNRPSRPSRYRASSFVEGRGEQSNVAIRFNRGDKGFYRGAGFYVRGMSEKPFVKPVLPVWVSGFNYELARGLASVGTTELPKAAKLLGLAA